MLGKHVGIRAHSQSAAAAIAFTENSDVYSSNGAPGERAAVHDEEPLCRHTTVWVSSHAREEWVPVIGVNGGQSEVDRVLREAHGFETALGVAAHVGRRDLRVAQPRELQRDDAVGVRPGPFVDVPVVPRSEGHTSPSSGSLLFAKMVPANPAMSDGKHSDA